MATPRIAATLLLASLLASTGCSSDPRGRGTFGEGELDAAALDARPVAVGGDARPGLPAEVEARFQPALEALRAAVDAGDDRLARAVLARLLEMGPSGPALELARGYERILDGRAAVAALELELEARFARDAGAGRVGVDFTAATRDGRSFDVRPGPGTLHVRFVSVDERGDESRSLQSVPIDTIGAMLVTPGAPSRIPLVELPFGLAPGALASRAIVELELRSGGVRPLGATGEDANAERELPAMRLAVGGAEVVVLARDLAAEPLTTADDLVALATSGACERRTALRAAVRVPVAERGAVLDRLARVHDTIAEPVLRAIAPALRWLAPDTNLGEDTAAWRAFLRDRARRGEPRETLRVPRRPAGG